MSRGLPPDLVRDDTSLKEYLKTDWLIKAMRRLESARKAAGYTPSELAKLLGTTQSAISRSESDMEGTISLRRYADWLFSCNVVPTDFEVNSLQSVRESLADDGHQDT